MNFMEDIDGARKLVEAARDSLAAKKKEIHEGHEVMREGIEKIASDIHGELGNYNNGIGDPVKFLDGLRKHENAEDLLTPEILALMEGFKNRTAILEVLEKADGKTPIVRTLKRASGQRSDSPKKRYRLHTAVEEELAQAPMPPPRPQPSLPPRPAPEKAAPPPPAQRQEPTPPIVRAKTGHVSEEEKQSILQRFQNLLDRFTDNPELPPRFLDSMRELYVQYAGRFDGEFTVRIRAFCVIYEDRVRKNEPISQGLPDKIRAKFPELFQGSQPRVTREPPPAAAAQALTATGALMLESDNGKNIDFSYGQRGRREERRLYVRKRIMGMAKNTGEVSAHEAAEKLKGLQTSRQTAEREILQLVEQGYLEVLREDEKGRKIYQVTAKTFVPEKKAPPEQPSTTSQETKLTSGLEGAIATKTVVSQLSSRPINPRDRDSTLDGIDGIIIKRTKGSGSISADPSQARAFGLSRADFMVRLTSMASRGLLRREGDGENVRFFLA